MNYELYHHGVKGMRWGVRKNKVKPANIQSSKPEQDKTDKKRKISVGKVAAGVALGTVGTLGIATAAGAYYVAYEFAKMILDGLNGNL